MIFTGAHQNMGYDRLMNTFSYLKKNIQAMAANIASAAEGRSLKQIQEIIQVWQIVTCRHVFRVVMGKLSSSQ